MKHSLIGDRSFYRQTIAVALPILLQNLITNLVAMLDNVMVGQLGDAPITAVSIVNNNLMFVLNVCMFGASAGAGIFTTQFYGSQNYDGIRHTFRFKLIICLLLAVAGCSICYFVSDPLIGLYLNGDEKPELQLQTLECARQYLYIMLIGVPAFAVTNAYASTLRECGHPTVPMVAGIVAMCVNLVGNFVLIFGHFGAPKLEAAGAAIATVASRYVEVLILILWTHLNPKKNPYVKRLYRNMYIPLSLLKSIIVKGMPLLVNEAAYTVGMALLNQCYSNRGPDVVAALSISTTLYNLTAVVFRSLGNATGIITGRMLGSGAGRKEVQQHNNKLLALCTATGVLCGLFTVAISGLFPMLFDTEDPAIAHIATGLITISAVLMPLQAYIFPVYFTLRAGGKTVITFIFDSGAIWLLMLPPAFLLSRYTGASIYLIFAICNGMDLIKCFVGYFFMRKGDWAQNLTV